MRSMVAAPLASAATKLAAALARATSSAKLRATCFMGFSWDNRMAGARRHRFEFVHHGGPIDLPRLATCSTWSRSPCPAASRSTRRSLK
ncbi:hypothetical protein [Cupriavidus sp. D39]|uniref:hypothetical protein n=1 Tax=Cupriavidus sp. D39 TaxID=2997877 RepID=UPI00226EEF52|nr:hypothetical protein [Cupriavidus sp. D39]MCY0855018.1 hypothetical protein [Cupriavidus sp. D39]